MNNIYKYIIAIFLTGLVVIPWTDLIAGNKDRSGQAGASELLINPWARSSGWGGVNIASVKGLEGMFVNVAGTAFTEGTQVIFSNTNWLKGSDVNIMAFGFSQRVGESSVLSLSVTNMSIGEILVRTVDLPEGGIGTISPSLMNVAVSYAKAFSNSIYGGMTMRIVSESISDVSAGGVAIDAGIQYITGEDENIKFGITLKNVGPRMQFSGDGLTIKTQLPGQETQFAVNQRSAEFELPTTMQLGAAYDFNFERSRLTLAGAFVSNSFTNDQFIGGIEFSFRDYVMIRGGYAYEDGITESMDSGERYNVNKGFSGGVSVQLPLNKEKGQMLSIDYSYRATDYFDGSHTFGASISL